MLSLVYVNFSAMGLVPRKVHSTPADTYIRRSLRKSPEMGWFLKEVGLIYIYIYIYRRDVAWALGLQLSQASRL